MTSIFYKTAEHKKRLLTAIQRIGKVYAGVFDPEYGSALYILTADLSTWNKAESYVTRSGIDFDELLSDVDFSGGYGVLISLASNLFNGNTHIDPVELLRLDPENFTVALTAIQIRRYPLRLDSFEGGK